MSDKKKDEFSFLQSAGLLCTIAGGALIIGFCWSSGSMRFSLLALAGAVAGWLLGVMLVPLNPKETKTFSQVAKIISSFISGYLLSKIDPLITAMVKLDPHGHAMIADEQVAKNFLVTLCSFGIAMLTVFSARAYFVKPEDATEAARKKAQLKAEKEEADAAADAAAAAGGLVAP